MDANRISYKKYIIKQDQISLKIFYEKIDHKYQIEFSYHIMRNTVSNYIKFITQKNSIENFKQNWKNYVPDLYIKYFPIFFELEELKLSKDYEKGFRLSITKNYLKYFNQKLNQY